MIRKKALIFTLDAVVALLVAILFLVAVSYFTSQSEQDPLPKVQLLNSGADLIRVLDQQGIFDEVVAGNNPEPLKPLEDALNDPTIKPSTLGIKILISQPGTAISIGPVGDLIIPKDRFVATGKSVTTISHKNGGSLGCGAASGNPEIKCFLEISYTVWKK